MGFFDFFGAGNKTDEHSGDITRYSKRISPLLDTLISGLFDAYHTVLLREDNDYIIYAVWGAKKDGELDDIQQEIHTRVEPVLGEIVDILEISPLSPAQRYAITYLVRGTIIARINYMVEYLRARYQKRQAGAADDAGSDVRHTGEPRGTGENDFGERFRRFDGGDFRRW